MRYQVCHKTTYKYELDVPVSYHLARLKPRDIPGQVCLANALAVEPLPVVVTEYLDYYSNPTQFLIVEGGHRRLVFTSRSLIEHTPAPSPEPSSTPPWQQVRKDCCGHSHQDTLAAGDFGWPSPLVPTAPEYADYAAASFPTDRPLWEAVLHLTQRIYTDFTFDPKATTTATPLSQVFKQKRGVCQDFAHLQIACLRSLGLPARYVSGYLETIPPPGKPRLQGADASHAWVACYCPGHGWLGVDPTNNVAPDGRHLTVAFGRDFGDVSPLRGILIGSGRHNLQVSVDVLPVPET